MSETKCLTIASPVGTLLTFSSPIANLMFSLCKKKKNRDGLDDSTIFLNEKTETKVIKRLT